MKKLIIALGAVAVAAGLQAATYNWSAMSNGAVFNGYDAPTMGTQWASATAQSGLTYYLIYTAGISQGDLLSGLRGGKTMADFSENTIISGTTGSDGKIAKETFTTDSSKFALDGDGKMSVYYAIFNSDDSSIYLSVAQSKAADLSGGQVSYSIATATSKILRDNDGTTAFGSAGWYSVAPEPTSGLLMLLGMAGLALRRRRA